MSNLRKADCCKWCSYQYVDYHFSDAMYCSVHDNIIQFTNVCDKFVQGGFRYKDAIKEEEKK